MEEHFRIFHRLFRGLVALTATMLVLDGFVAPFRHFLERLSLDEFVVKSILISPVIVGALWVLECLLVRSYPQERRTVLIDLALLLGWGAVCLALLIYSLTHFAFL
jgi:hypothetical protein